MSWLQHESRPAVPLIYISTCFSCSINSAVYAMNEQSNFANIFSADKNSARSQIPAPSSAAQSIWPRYLRIAWHSMMYVFVTQKNQCSILPQVKWYVKTQSMSSQRPFHKFMFNEIKFPSHWLVSHCMNSKRLPWLNWHPYIITPSPGLKSKIHKLV